MPYITKEARAALRGSHGPTTVGELNYVITAIVHAYVRDHGMRYATLNDVVGVLECAKAEFIRRIASPYEDEQIKKNGDIGVL